MLKGFRSFDFITGEHQDFWQKTEESWFRTKFFIVVKTMFLHIKWHRYDDLCRAYCTFKLSFLGAIFFAWHLQPRYFAAILEWLVRGYVHNMFKGSQKPKQIISEQIWRRRRIQKKLDCADSLHSPIPHIIINTKKKTGWDKKSVGEGAKRQFL